MTLLRVKNIQKRFGELPILNNISIELERGEILGLVGRSGSGKTTLLRIIGGLEKANLGTVELNGEILEGPDKKLVPGYEEIRIVHQDFRLKHRMSVRENIRYELLSFTKEYQEERLNTLLELCQIQMLQDRDISEISGGEKQRVALARALATEPDVLLMDEPFSSLDHGIKMELLQEVKSLAKKLDLAIIMVTHDSHDALAISDRIAVLKRGEIIRMDTPKNLFKDPQSKYTALLFGSFNILESKQLKEIIPAFRGNGQHYGIWPHHILPAKNGVQATILSKTFLGPTERFELDVKGIRLQMMANSSNDFADQNLSIGIVSEAVFHLPD